MRGRRTAAAAALFAGLLGGLGAGPVSGLLDRAEPDTRSVSASTTTATRTAVERAASVLVIAHRGFSDIAPENTLPAMQAAVDANANLVEFDVRRSADGHLIVVHDTTFARTTNVHTVFPDRASDPVSTFTLAEIQQLDAGSWKGPQFAGTRIPTVDQVLATIHPSASGLLLELKTPTLYPGCESQVVDALVRHGFIGSGRVHIHSLDPEALATLRRLAPSTPLGLITEDSSRAGMRGQDTWLDLIDPVTGSIADAAVGCARGLHLKVLAWPLPPGQGSPAHVRRLLDDGVDGIITDNPILVRHEITAAGPTTT